MDAQRDRAGDKPGKKKGRGKGTTSPPIMPMPEVGTVWAEGWMCDGWPASTPDPRWLR